MKGPILEFDLPIRLASQGLFALDASQEYQLLQSQCQSRVYTRQSNWDIDYVPISTQFFRSARDSPRLPQSSSHELLVMNLFLLLGHPAALLFIRDDFKSKPSQVQCQAQIICHLCFGQCSKSRRRDGIDNYEG
jgi:hypothetical protein